MIDSRIKKIVILAIIFMATFVPISNAFTIDDILTQGDNFIQEGKNNKYATYIDENGKEQIKYETYVDENGEIQYKLDKNGNKIPIPILDEEQLQRTVNQVYNILLTIGIGLSVLVGAMLGIKYMISSVEEQAKIKETLIPYVLGCFVVFGAFGIWKIIIEFGQNIF